MSGVEDFATQWAEAVLTSLGFFWKALWAFVLGYGVSAAIQVFVTQERMQRVMGGDDARSVGLGGFFGFISSSCSFAALATTRSLLAKGAGLIPALAFLLASTNLVVELGIIIMIFLGWQFVVGEYVGGILLILFTWLLVRLFYPESWLAEARERLDEETSDDGSGNWRQAIRTREGWTKVANQYIAEWRMVWKDITIGFTAAGIIAVFVPTSFFQTLFIGAGDDSSSILEIFQHTLIGPIAAVATFIGSMGNIPLATVLIASGVSFAGVMAFIFSDLIVIPVVRISAEYFGWKLALYIVGVFFVSLVATALTLHAGFALLGILPSGDSGSISTDRFSINYTFFLNLIFLAISGVFAWLYISGKRESDSVEREHSRERSQRSAEGGSSS